MSVLTAIKNSLGSATQTHFLPYNLSNIKYMYGQSFQQYFTMMSISMLSNAHSQLVVMITPIYNDK